MKQSNRLLDANLILLFVLSLWALTPLLSPGYFYDAHDGRHSAFYVSMFHESMQDAVQHGSLWPRWAMHHAQGYGYPTFIIQAPGAFYVAEFFILLGVGITNAVKLTFAVGFLASGWGMYALVKAWIPTSIPSPGEKSSAIPSLAPLVAGLLYVYAPYHLVDTYVRAAALAETMLFAWLPWVFLAFDRLIQHGKEAGWQGRLLLAALSYAGLLLTHVFALLSVTPLLAAFILFRLWQGRSEGRVLIGRTLLALAGGVGALFLSAIFILPLLVEGPLLSQEVFVTGTYSYERHWVYWGQFLSSFWGFGYSDDPSGANDGMSFQLGSMLVVVAIVGLLFGLARWQSSRKQFGRQVGQQSDLVGLGFLLSAAFVVLFVMTPAAAPLWHRLPMLAVIQFPWRLLILACFLLSAIGGLVLDSIVRQSHQLAQKTETTEINIGAILIALLVIYASSSYLQAVSLQPIEPWREDGRAVFEFEAKHPDMIGYTGQVEEHFTQSPLTAQYAAADFSNNDFSNDSLERLGIIQGEGTVTQHYSRGQSFGGAVEMHTAGSVQVRLYDFPGWQVLVDGKATPHRLSPPDGLIEVDVAVGPHQIDVYMGSTPVRSAGVAISGLTLALLIGLWVWGKRASYSTLR